MSELTTVFKTQRAIAIPAFAAAPFTRTAAVAFAAAGTIAFRLLLIARYRFDSDETQHLHVAWAWAHGLVQYRDVFDNHMPLFHLLFAPLVRVAGESPATLVVARLSMLPFFAAMVWLTYRIALACLPLEIAVLATITGCLAPDFFLCSSEFRADVLWAASWLACIAILVIRPLTHRSAAAAGLALGIAAATSAKTSLLAASLIAAAVVTMRTTRIEWRRVVPLAASFAGAAAVPLALLAAFFASIGAWQAFVYCTISHNVVASEHPARLLVVPVAVVLITLGSRAILRQSAPEGVIRRRMLLFLTASIYAAALMAFWPIIEVEHWLPFYPVAAAGLAPLLFGGDRRLRIALGVIAIEVVSIVASSTPWIDHASESLALVDDAMRLTRDGEHVVDLKGETVFLPRASYWVFEKLTRRAISHGRIADSTSADVAGTGAMVAAPDSAGFPRAGRSFLRHNFISVGCVRVAGKLVSAGKAFAIEVPGAYALVGEGPPIDADLDGLPYTGPRPLGRGPHVITVRGAPARMAVVWQRAVAAGFSPFAPDRRCDNANFRIEERHGLTHPAL